MCRTKIYWLGKFCNIDDAIAAADAAGGGGICICPTLSVQYVCVCVYDA